MEYTTRTKEQAAAFDELPRTTPVCIFSLIRFHDRAQYDDGTVASGREAYRAYKEAALPGLKEVGARVVFAASYELTLIGPTDERWDDCFILEYSSAADVIRLRQRPSYEAAQRHRKAAVADYRLMRFGAPWSRTDQGEVTLGDGLQRWVEA